MVGAFHLLREIKRKDRVTLDRKHFSNEAGLIGSKKKARKTRG
jgi:hypothetical protein